MIYLWYKNYIPMASNKLKPSSKEYKKDKLGKPTKVWYLKHYTVTNTSSEELQKLYASPSQKKNRNKIKKELIKRGLLN